MVEADGSVYPCDFYVLDDWRMGCLQEERLETLVQGEVFTSFLRQGSEKPEECTACRWRGLCNGGCTTDWNTVDGRHHNRLCAAMKKYFAYAEPRLMAIAREEQRARMRSGL